MKALAALLLLALFPSTSTLVLQFDASWREVHLPFVPTALHDGAPPEAKAYRAVVASCAAVVLTDKGTPLALGGRCFTQSNEAAIVKVKEAPAAGKPKERATATAAKRKVKRKGALQSMMLAKSAAEPAPCIAEGEATCSGGGGGGGRDGTAVAAAVPPLPGVPPSSGAAEFEGLLLGLNSSPRTSTPAQRQLPRTPGTTRATKKAAVAVAIARR